MAARELFTECSFTLSDKVPGQDKHLMKEITKLGFSVIGFDPLTINKSSPSSSDIENLLGVINHAFEPQVGEDFEIIESGPSLGGGGDQNVASSFPEASESRASHKSEVSSNSFMDNVSGNHSVKFFSLGTKNNIDGLCLSLANLDLEESKDAPPKSESLSNEVSEAHDITPKIERASSQFHSGTAECMSEKDPDLVALRKLGSPSADNVTSFEPTNTNVLQSQITDSGKAQSVVKKEIVPECVSEEDPDLVALRKFGSPSIANVACLDSTNTKVLLSQITDSGKAQSVVKKEVVPDFKMGKQSSPHNTDESSNSAASILMAGKRDKSKRAHHDVKSGKSTKKLYNDFVEDQVADEKLTDNDKNTFEKQSAILKSGDEEENFFDCQDSMEHSSDDDQLSSLTTGEDKGNLAPKKSIKTKSRVSGSKEAGPIITEKTAQENFYLGGHGQITDDATKMQIDANQQPGKKNYSQKSGRDLHNLHPNSVCQSINVEDSETLNRIRNSCKHSARGHKRDEHVDEKRSTWIDNTEISKTDKGSFEVGEKKPEDFEISHAMSGSANHSISQIEVSYTRQPNSNDDEHRLQRNPNSDMSKLERKIYPDLQGFSQRNDTETSYVAADRGRTDPLGNRNFGEESDSTHATSAAVSHANPNYSSTSARSHFQHTERHGIQPDGNRISDREVENPHLTDMAPNSVYAQSDLGQGLALSHHQQVERDKMKSNWLGQSDRELDHPRDKMESNWTRQSDREPHHPRDKMESNWPKQSDGEPDYPRDKMESNWPRQSDREPHHPRDKMESNWPKQSDREPDRPHSTDLTGNVADLFTNRKQKIAYSHSQHTTGEKIKNSHFDCEAKGERNTVIDSQPRQSKDVEMTDVEMRDMTMSKGGTSRGLFHPIVTEQPDSSYQGDQNRMPCRDQTMHPRSKQEAEDHMDRRHSDVQDEDSDTSGSESETEEPNARRAREEGSRLTVVKPNTMMTSGMDQTGKSSSIRKYSFQGRQVDRPQPSLEIPCDPNTDVTLLSYIALLPSKEKLTNVEVSLEQYDKGFILLTGKPDEVLQAADIIQTVLKDKQNTLVHQPRQQSRNRDEDRYTHQSGPPVDNYSSTYKDDYGPKKPLRGERRDSGERRKYGSSVDQMSSSSDEFVTEKRRITVNVIKGDITTLKVDAIVNAANSRLKHGGGVARAIADKAGPKLQIECSEYIKGEAKIPVTGLFVSTGGKLPAKHVFHAVGPRWDRYDETRKLECARDLRLTVFRCLLEANRRGVKSIAIPSISAAIFKVPKDICTRAYLEAVKTYDLYCDKMKRSSLEEIVFVDIAQEMVTSIQERFSLDWDKELSLRQATEDFEFAANYLTHNREPKETTQNRSTWYSRFLGNSQGVQTKKPMEESQRSHESRPQSPVRRQIVSEEQMYTVGQCRLRTRTEAALRQHADLVVVVGDLFRKLHDSPVFDVTTRLHLKSEYPVVKNKFTFYEGLKPFSVILNLDLENQSYSQNSIDKAFGTLKELTDSVGNLLQAQSVIFTSSLLFSGDPTAGAYPHRFDQKLVGDFTRNVYKFLESLRPSKGLLSATIATGAEALTTITKVLDSRQKGQERKGGSRKATEPQEEDCGICRYDKFERHPLSCCEGVLCTTCAKKVQRCPFCQKPFCRMTGIQPDGCMKIFCSQFSLKGYEKYKTYNITYEFPGGKQGPEHPDPGKKYEPVKRIAYIPVNEEGNRVLQLLRLAFLRRLTFTIGDSMTTNKKGVITWNDIHHKTSLKEGSTFGYPDPKYLSKVSQELTDRGVTMESMSEEEKRDLLKMERDLQSKHYFFDLDPPGKKH